MTGISIFRSVNIKPRLVGLVIAVFGLTAAIACTGLESLDAEAAQAVVQNIDSLSGEVTVAFKDGTTTTFNLADVNIEALGQLIGRAALEAGDEIEVELDSSNRVKALTPHSAKVRGVITDVDLDANTVTIESENGVELTLALTAQTRIELGEDEHGTVDGLLAGMAVKVKYNVDTDEALKIKHEVEGDHDADDDEVKGVITAIDPDAHTITVEARNGSSQTYTAHSDTEIEIHGPASFADLEVGMQVKVEFDPDTLALHEVEVRGDEGDRDRDEDDEHEAKGVITALNSDAHTITVEARNGISETYTAHSDTEIEIHGPASFADLEVGMQVKVEFDPDTLALHEVEVRVEDDDDEDDEDEQDDHDRDDEEEDD